MSGAQQGGPGEEYIADPAPNIIKGKRSNDGPGADRVGKKMAGLVTSATPWTVLPMTTLQQMNFLSLSKSSKGKVR